MFVDFQIYMCYKVSDRVTQFSLKVVTFGVVILQTTSVDYPSDINLTSKTLSEDLGVAFLKVIGGYRGISI